MKKIRKKGWIAAFIFSAVVVVMTGFTVALLTGKTQTAANYFKGAAVNIGVVENETLYESGVNSEFSKIETGVLAAKSVAVQNIDTQEYPTTDTYVRVRLVPSFVYEDGENQGTVAAVDWSNQLVYTYGDTKHWKCQQVDGETYYYYTKKLSPGKSTSELITGVTYLGEVPQGTYFQLQVLTEGIAANQRDGDTKAPKGAWGIELSQLETLKNQ